MCARVCMWLGRIQTNKQSLFTTVTVFVYIDRWAMTMSWTILTAHILFLFMPCILWYVMKCRESDGYPFIKVIGYGQHKKISGQIHFVGYTESHVATSALWHRWSKDVSNTLCLMLPCDDVGFFATIYTP